MIELDRAQARLQNIRSVQPILSALHTISLGSWQAALNRQSRVQRYMERLETLLPVVAAHVPFPHPLFPLRIPRHEPAVRRSGQARGGEARRGSVASTGEVKTVALVIGSERGLCGRFNTAVVERAEAHLTGQKDDVELMALGGRVRRVLERHGRQVAWSGSLSITALPPFELASHLSHRWLTRYEARELDAVDLIYNAYRGMGSYEPVVMRLIPPSPPLSPPQAGGMKGEEIPTIIETDPLSLYTHVIEQWTATRLYELLLESAAAEHSARYELMGSATQNTDRLVAELTLAIQTARQQAITQEMQELAAGAGMIGMRNR
ncbi:MAG: F0F1 ATP synthase subunit gamma [Anaerolineae bacterium]|nr:F0F1 ATP synthase subunit gamma [Anaerolineae bacterium]